MEQENAAQRGLKKEKLRRSLTKLKTTKNGVLTTYIETKGEYGFYWTRIK